MRAFRAAALLLIGCSRAPSPPSPAQTATVSVAASPPTSTSLAASQAPSVAPSRPASPLPPPPEGGVYMGRRVAAPMGYQGADWLERTDREATDKPEHVLDAIAFKPSDVVADVGAGSGYFTERIARRLKSGGRVIATDLQPEMLAMIRKKADKSGATNIETRRATETDSALLPGTIDLALMVDVYHELPRPDLTLAQVRTALRTGGRLVLVEYRGEDPRVAIKPEHKMTLPQIKRELEGASFSITLVDESLPHQRIVIAEPKP